MECLKRPERKEVYIQGDRSSATILPLSNTLHTSAQVTDCVAPNARASFGPALARDFPGGVFVRPLRNHMSAFADKNMGPLRFCSGHRVFL